MTGALALSRWRLVIGLAMLALPAAADAQEAATVLLLPAGTRAVGFGGAFVAGDGPEALFSNPAQIGGRGLTLSVARVGGAATLGSLATVEKVAGMSMALGVRYLDFGAATGAFPSAAGALGRRGADDASSLDAMVAVQHGYFGFRVGAAAHYAAEQRSAGRAAGVLLDAGVARDVAGVTWGVSVQNLGGDLVLNGSSAPPPSRATLGAFRDGIRLGTWFDLALAAAVSREPGGRVAPMAGAELTWEPVAGWTFTGRLGARRPASPGLPGPSAITAGASFGLDDLTLDYAWQPYRGGVGGVHQFGVRIR